MNFSPTVSPEATDASNNPLPLQAKRGFDLGQFVSRTFNFVYIIGSFALVIALPFDVNKWGIVARTLWLAGSAALNFGVVQGFKFLCYFPRPNTGNRFCWGRRHHSGFPSGHTLPAFMMATMITRAHPHLWFWFAAATLIAWARWHVKAHYGYQVALSAALGVLMGLFMGRFL